MPSRESRYSRAQAESDNHREERRREVERPLIREREDVSPPARRGDGAGSDRIAELERLLRINENALEEACVVQPDLLYSVATELARQRSRRDRKKKQVEETEARAYLRFRHQGEGERVTEAECRARIAVDSDCQRVAEELLAENELLGRWEALREAAGQRSYMLRELCGLHLARYYGNDVVGSAERRAREFTADRVREIRGGSV